MPIGRTIFLVLFLHALTVPAILAFPGVYARSSARWNNLYEVSHLALQPFCDFYQRDERDATTGPPCGPVHPTIEAHDEPVGSPSAG